MSNSTNPNDDAAADTTKSPSADLPIVGKPQNLFENYDPEAVRTAIAETAGSWSDVDVDEFIAELYAAREKGSRPATRP